MSRYPIRTPRRRTDQYGDLWIDGEFYMGKVRVPSMPPRIAMRDRMNEDYKVLSHSSGVISLVDIDTSWPDVIKYDKYDGPYDATGRYRLLLYLGTLMWEAVVLDAAQTTYTSARILTRSGFDTTVLEITRNSTDGSVVYTEIEL